MPPSRSLGQSARLNQLIGQRCIKACAMFQELCRSLGHQARPSRFCFNNKFSIDQRRRGHYNSKLIQLHRNDRHQFQVSTTQTQSNPVQLQGLLNFLQEKGSNAEVKIKLLCQTLSRIRKEFLANLGIQPIIKL